MDIETHVVPSSSLKVDVHLPKKRPAGKLAAIFAIHPGGLVSYDKSLIAPWLIDLAAREGYALVSPDYRLLVGEGAGAADGCLDDVLAAYDWAFGGSGLLASALDPARVMVAGFSAGGLLALLVPTQIARPLPSPRALLLLYPVVSPFTSPFYSTPRTPSAPLAPFLRHGVFWSVARAVHERVSREPAVQGGDGVGLDFAAKLGLEREGEKGYRGMLYDLFIQEGTMRNVWATGTTSPASATNPALTDAELERIIPLSASNPPQAGLPTLLIHGSGDTLVPVSESETVYRALQAAGAGSTARLIMPPDEEHAFELEQPLVGSKHSSLFEEVCAWLKLALST